MKDCSGTLIETRVRKWKYMNQSAELEETLLLPFFSFYLFQK